MLKIKELTKSFKTETTKEKIIINNLSVDVKKGEFISIIGSNGAGKSTLFNCIAGSTEISSGSITLDNVDITKLPSHKRAKFIGRLFQDPLAGTAPSMSIKENLFLSSSEGGWLKKANIKDEKSLKEKLSLLSIGLEDRIDEPVGLLSGGQRQALTLLMATYQSPKLLLLDEHTAALDPEAAERIMALTDKIVKEKNLTCLMITHNMKTALLYGSRTIMMHSGKIIFDTHGEERKKLTVDDLLIKFKSLSSETINTDRMMMI